METLYTKINKLKKDKNEIKDVEKRISKYINQRKIRKILFKGLKENFTIKNDIDDKQIILHIDKMSYSNYFSYQYIFIVREKDDSILEITITPTIFNTYFKIKFISFHQNKITSKQIIDYLKLTIGID